MALWPNPYQTENVISASTVFKQGLPTSGDCPPQVNVVKGECDFALSGFYVTTNILFE